MEPLGRKRWAIAEGYIPTESTGLSPEMESHETACLLNVSEQEAQVAITVFFSDREPAGPYRVTVPPAERSICGSTSSTTPSRSRREPTTPA